ncbi:hypothetical protein D3C79_958880 [compost metagenome]
MICPSLSSRFAWPATARMVPVASNTAVITSANTLGSTTGFNAPMISRLKISELPLASVRLGMANSP